MLSTSKMMSEVEKPDIGKVQDAENQRDSLRWSVRLSSNEPGKVAVILMAAVAAFLIGTFVFGKLLLGLAGSMIVVGATMEYLVGAVYNVDSKGVSSKVGLSFTSMEWPEVKRVIRTKNGLQLSPFENAGTRDAFRGVFLRYGAENRETVINTVRRLLPENVRLHDARADGSGDGRPD